jgi:beta-lactam-binding protein with PASTA domain
VSKGSDVVTVPDVRGMTTLEATEALERAGLEVSQTYGDVRPKACDSE